MTKSETPFASRLMAPSTSRLARVASLAPLLALVSWVGACDLLPGAPLPCRDDLDCASGERCEAQYCTVAEAPADGGLLRDGGVEPDPAPTDGGVEPDPAPSDGGVEPDPAPTDGGAPEPPVDAGPGGGPDGGGDGGVPDAGPIDAGPADAGPNGPVPLPPEAITTFAVDALLSPALEEEVVVSAAGCDNALVFTTDATTDPWSSRAPPSSPANCSMQLSNLNAATRLVRRGADGPAVDDGLVVAAARSWTFPSNIQIQVRGDDRVAFFGEDFITIDGAIEASGQVSNLGPVATVVVDNGPGGLLTGSCVGGDGVHDGNEGGGGGGAGGATSGAAGGAGKNESLGGAGGVAQDPASFSGLVPGCRGGKGAKADNPNDAGGNGGPPGGAIQFASLGVIDGTGTVRANGGRGLIGARDEKDGGGGGGSGGTIWLVGLHVNFGGTLMANGGAGAGSGGLDTDETGTFGARAALGRSAVGGSCGDSYTGSFPNNTECGSGGAGGWRVAPTVGYTATASGNVSGGGGGGAAGRIYITSINACATTPTSSPAIAVPSLNGFEGFACAFDAPVCGNGVVEDGEVCDDGANLFSISRCGCNASCQEEEPCGPGEVINNNTINDVNLGSTDRRLTVEGVDFVSTISGNAHVRVDCEDESNCNINCDSVEESCQVVCRRGATCDLSCNSVGGDSSDDDLCVLFCEDGATCSISFCNSVGDRDPTFCAMRPFTTLE